MPPGVRHHLDAVARAALVPVDEVKELSRLRDQSSRGQPWLDEFKYHRYRQEQPRWAGAFHRALRDLMILSQWRREHCNPKSALRHSEPEEEIEQQSEVRDGPPTRDNWLPVVASAIDDPEPLPQHRKHVILFSETATGSLAPSMPWFRAGYFSGSML
ncbi:hypothetical protein [Homoserinibacter sp. GY 40078]|uniref:hypothetical protein n=1 Tax=Homoserinibacter sp. GY 40078 TaxID=2603275 RepID=UPI0011CBE404|nr:hypothetical protein [Homoserinibacter sp. GY 40078]TXK19117.1 hypothetical protein FVQ89_04125 [Homoserinibacter sp. GY 40078]